MIKKERERQREKRVRDPRKRTYLFCGEHGLVRYWHIGNRRNSNAIVARTVREQRAGREEAER